MKPEAPREHIPEPPVGPGGVGRGANLDPALSGASEPPDPIVPTGPPSTDAFKRARERRRTRATGWLAGLTAVGVVAIIALVVF